MARHRPIKVDYYRSSVAQLKEEKGPLKAVLYDRKIPLPGLIPISLLGIITGISLQLTFDPMAIGGEYDYLLDATTIAFHAVWFLSASALFWASGIFLYFKNPRLFIAWKYLPRKGWNFSGEVPEDFQEAFIDDWRYQAVLRDHVLGMDVGSLYPLNVVLAKEVNEQRSVIKSDIVKIVTNQLKQY